jgi:outer membrane protein assembly factor BamE (lipoprotein component of BamABCDE complex)
MSISIRHIVLVLCFVSGCSVYMEATRPTPVDLAKFNPGDSRSSVTQELGSPVSTSKGAGGTSCDLYLLYTKG